MLLAAWDRFWFRPVPTSTLALLRIAFGVVTLAWAAALVRDTGDLFGPGGVTDGYSTAPLVVAVLVVAAGCVIVGFHAQLAAAVTFFCMVWLHRVNPLVWNSGDVLLRHVAGFLALAPCGEPLSVDRWRRHGDLWACPPRAPWPVRLLQLELALMYVVAFTSKLHGWSWRHGTAVSYVLRLPDDTRFSLPTSITASTTWAHVLTWGTLAVEAAIPLLVWHRRTRPVVVVAGVALHVAIHLTMRVGFFSWVVLLGYLAFLPPDTAERLIARVRATLSGSGRSTTTAVIGRALPDRGRP